MLFLIKLLTMEKTGVENSQLMNYPEKLSATIKSENE